MISLTRPPKQDLDLEVVRPLTEEDMQNLFTERDSAPQRIRRISDRHHALARLLAAGVSESDAALMTGYAIVTVSILKTDPTFTNLMDFYRKDEGLKVRDLQEKMLGISNEAADVLLERLEEAPDKIPTNQLLEIISRTADRTGNGPKTVTETNVNVNIADRLTQARNRVKTINALSLEVEE